jgi:hypothetical protein
MLKRKFSDNSEDLRVLLDDINATTNIDALTKLDKLIKCNLTDFSPRPIIESLMINEPIIEKILKSNNDIAIGLGLNILIGLSYSVNTNEEYFKKLLPIAEKLIDHPIDEINLDAMWFINNLLTDYNKIPLGPSGPSGPSRLYYNLITRKIMEVVSFKNTMNIEYDRVLSNVLYSTIKEDCRDNHLLADVIIIVTKLMFSSNDYETIINLCKCVIQIETYDTKPNNCVSCFLHQIDKRLLYIVLNTNQFKQSPSVGSKNKLLENAAISAIKGMLIGPNYNVKGYMWQQLNTTFDKLLSDDSIGIKCKNIAYDTLESILNNNNNNIYSRTVAHNLLRKYAFLNFDMLPCLLDVIHSYLYNIM